MAESFLPEYRSNPEAWHVEPPPPTAVPPLPRKQLSEQRMFWESLMEAFVSWSLLASFAKVLKTQDRHGGIYRNGVTHYNAFRCEDEEDSYLQLEMSLFQRYMAERKYQREHACRKYLRKRHTRDVDRETPKE